MQRALPVVVALLVLAAPALAQAPRNGAELRFATLGSSGGMQGSSFLPISRSDVHLRPADATCSSARVEIRARGLRGLVRNLQISMRDVSSPGQLTIGPGCAEAQVKVKLESGVEVDGPGTLRVVEAHREGETKLVLDLEWSPRVQGQALPMTGHIVVPMP